MGTENNRKRNNVSIVKNGDTMSTNGGELNVSRTNEQEIREYQNRANGALAMIDDIVLKNYLTKLGDMDIIPMEAANDREDLILYKINKMVYEKDEYATDKFISVVSAMTFASNSIYLIIDGKEDKTDFYLGIKNGDKSRNAVYISEALESSLKGQFPGIILEDISIAGKGEAYSLQEKLIHRFSESNSISSCVGIPAYKNKKGDYTNQNFIQGIDKFATAMQGKVYTAVILASNMSAQEIRSVRAGYENIYTELSAMATQQMGYSTNESLSNALSRTKGYSDSESQSNTIGKSSSISHGTSSSTGTTTGETTGESEDNIWGKLKSASVATSLVEAGAILTGTGVAAPVGIAMMGIGAVVGIGGAFGSKNKNKSTSTSSNESTSESQNSSLSKSESSSKTEGHTENFSETNGQTASITATKNFTLTLQSKHIQEVMKRIDKQLERIELCESTGLWSSGAYFLSYDKDNATAEIGAAIFRSIMQGEQSGVEMSAINTWYKRSGQQYKLLAEYVSNFAHPIFNYTDGYSGLSVPVFPTSLISSKELSMMVGLPRKSVPGLPVIEQTSFAKEVVRLSNSKNEDFTLGCIYDQGVKRELNKVSLDAKSLTQHTFVTGSTGCGKSNTIYYLLSQIQKQSSDVKFLIVEPAKGEYKDVFGNVNVYGTNPLVSDILKLNPFKFPKGVHVLEHIDKLIEIFNVCWPMYAAMPAVLKEATLEAYKSCGWDFVTSKNIYSEDLFPTFTDLQTELVEVISNSAYSEEVKSNYQGSLVTRIKSLTNGLNGQIFCGDELGDEKLFDENVVVDLSRIGSQETKSLIMGLLIMRLSEYRSVSGITPNSPLRHITVLEEAHNILKKCSQDQSMEGSNVAGKSVEMISNAIAEMRTYGEGFVIVDQSPGAVDISAIRNTNTKIIMRLPEDSDRKAIGKAAAMKDKQIDEIAKLGTGVAVVYQNDWEEPVLCQIEMFKEEPIPYVFEPKPENNAELRQLELDAIKFLLKGKVTEEEVEFDLEKLKCNLSKFKIKTSNKVNIYRLIDQYNVYNKLSIWDNTYYDALSLIIADILSVNDNIGEIVNKSQNFDSLNQELRDLLHDRLGEFSRTIEVPLMQHVIKGHSYDMEDNSGFYETWSKALI